MANALRAGFHALVRLMVNMKFAVGWLLLMGALAIYGTVFLSGAESMAFFRTPLFSFVLLVFAVALVVAVLSRYPWKQKHIGWILTHAGLVIIVIGHLITARHGFEGIVSLTEGESTHVLEQALPGGSLIWDLQVDLPQTGAHEAITLLPDDLAKKPDMPVEVGPFSVGGAELIVERYVPTLELQSHTEPDFSSPEPYPAYRIDISDGDVSRAAWVLADETRGRMRLGNVLTCRYLVLASVAERDALLGADGASNDNAAERAGFLELGDTGKKLAVSTLLGAPQPLGSSGVQARVLRRFERLRIVDNAPVELPDGPLNQALELELIGAEGERETIWLFAQLPQFDMRPKTIALPFELRYRAKAQEARPFLPSSVTLVHVLPKGVSATAEPEPDGALLVLTDPRGRREVRPFRLGEPFEIGWIGRGLVARITDRWDRVRVITEPRCASYEPRRPALRVRVRDGGDEQSAWVVWNPRNQPSEVVLPNLGPVLLRYGPRQLELGFRIELLDFVLETYEGIDQPKSFESFVRTSDHAGTVSDGAHTAPRAGEAPVWVPVADAAGFEVGQVVRVGTNDAFYYGTVRAIRNAPGAAPAIEIERLDRRTPLTGGQEVPSGVPVLAIAHIYMNHPLVHRGFTFFQSSYDPETLRRSTFQVSYDPGWKTVYVGYAVTVFGLMFIVWVKPVLLRREARRRAKAALARRAAKAESSVRAPVLEQTQRTQGVVS